MEILKKLKIIGSTTIYSTENTWDTYRNFISPLRDKIVKEEIVLKNTKYLNSFDEEYRKVTTESGWGSNLDEYLVKIDSKLNVEMRYHKVKNFYSTGYQRELVWIAEFKLPKTFLPQITKKIESDFYYHCFDLHEQELQIAKEKRIKEIQQELLSKTK
jgi:hypothetical protein